MSNVEDGDVLVEIELKNKIATLGYRAYSGNPEVKTWRRIVNLADDETIQVPLYSNEQKELEILRDLEIKDIQNPAKPKLRRNLYLAKSGMRYFIENRAVPKRNDWISEFEKEKIRFTPIIGVSQRFPELYKHLSRANTRKQWKQVPGPRKLEILQDGPKIEILRHVLDNMDSPKPERRFGPRHINPSRFQIKF